MEEIKQIYRKSKNKQEVLIPESVMELNIFEIDH